MSEELEFLARYDASAFPRPSLAVDIIVLTCPPTGLEVLVLHRTEHPDKGKWTLPGGFVGFDEDLPDAATRLLSAKAGVDDVWIEQLRTFGTPGRDPRTRVVSVAYIALVPPGTLQPTGATLAPIRVPWEGETGGPVEVLGDDGPLVLGFDHAEMLGTAVQRLRGKLDYSNVVFSLLPASFTLLRLQQVHEAILGRTVNKDSFRRRMLASGLLEATGERQRDVGHRPAALYRFSGATDPKAGRHGQGF
jgi:8-oxo-dGTP diphosphatase